MAKHTNKQRDGPRDSMTESAQWGRFSENLPCLKHPLLLLSNFGNIKSKVSIYFFLCLLTFGKA